MNPIYFIAGFFAVALLTSPPGVGKDNRVAISMLTAMSAMWVIPWEMKWISLVTASCGAMACLSLTIFLLIVHKSEGQNK